MRSWASISKQSRARTRWRFSETTAPRPSHARCVSCRDNSACAGCACHPRSSIRHRKHSSRLRSTARRWPTRTRASRRDNGRDRSCFRSTDKPNEQLRHAQLLQRPATFTTRRRRFRRRPGTPIRAANHGTVVARGSAVLHRQHDRDRSRRRDCFRSSPICPSFTSSRVTSVEAEDDCRARWRDGTRDRPSPPLERSLERRPRRSALTRRCHHASSDVSRADSSSGVRQRRTRLRARRYVQLRAELADRFGGVTAYTRAPARGVWKDDTGEKPRATIS